MAPHSSTLAWKIPWTEEPGRLQSLRSLRVGHDWATSLSLVTFMHWRRQWHPTPVFLPGESQGWGSLVGCRLWGHRVGHDWSDLAAAAGSQKIEQRGQRFPLYPLHPQHTSIASPLTSTPLQSGIILWLQLMNLCGHITIISRFIVYMRVLRQ